MTTIAHAPISKSELHRLTTLPEYIGSKLELWDGELYVLKPTPSETTLKARLLRLLRERYRAHPIGYILQDAQIELPGERIVLKPALSIVNSHQPGFTWDCALNVIPQCVIEIASRGESVQHLHAKAVYYAQHGCMLPLTVYPVEHSLEILTPTGFRHLLPRDILDGGPALPGFCLPVWRVFNG